MESFRHRPEILEGVPENLVRDLKQFEDWFTVDSDGLKHVTDHFVRELEKGLTYKGGSVVSNFRPKSPLTINADLDRVLYSQCLSPGSWAIRPAMSKDVS